MEENSTSNHHSRVPHNASIDQVRTADVTNSVMRYAQLKSEANHKHSVEGNKRALLAERLARLAELSNYLQETDWKYTKKEFEYCEPQKYGKGIEERHFSLGKRL